MCAPLLTDHVRFIRADCEHLHISLVELSLKFCQSPQLGDTIGSPMTAKELDKHWRTSQVARSKTFTRIIQRSKNRDGVTYTNGILSNLLRADCDRER